MHDVTEVMNLLDKKKKLAKKIETLEKEYDELAMNIETICPHPNVVKTEHYSKGGYDYLSSVTITISCSICNKTLKSYDDPKHRGSFS